MTHHQPRTVDFFTREALAAPQVTPDQARRIAAASFGITARTESLGSQQDANFLLLQDDGTPAAVLKIANPAFSATEIDAQDTAADLIAAAHPDLRLATVLRTPDGAPQTATVHTDGGPATARLLRYLHGGTLSGPRHLSPPTVAAMGRVAGRVSTALHAFHHPGLERVLQWDLRYADRVVGLLLEHIPEAARRTAVLAATAEAWTEVGKVGDQLPRQAVHLDLTDDNLVRSPDSRLPLPDGIIDFGDVTASWAVGELAVTLSSMLHHDGMEPHQVLPAVRAFHEVRPLSAEEAAALWPLTVLRAATLVVSGRHQAAVDADNAYVLANLDQEWRIFEQATAVPSAVMTGLINETLGLAERRRTPAPPPVKPLVAGPTLDDVAILDLSTEAETMDHGAWLEENTADRIAASLLAQGTDAVATEYAQAQLSAATVLSHSSPATIATGIDLWLLRPTVLQAPCDGELLHAGPGHAVLTCRPHVLHLSFTDAVQPSLPAGTSIRAGDQLVSLPAGAHVHVSLRQPAAPAVPALVRPEYAAGWLALTADPPRSSARPPPAPRRSRTCSPDATPPSPPSRSTTTTTRPASNAVGGTTCCPPTDGPTWTWSTTSPPRPRTPPRGTGGLTAVAQAQHQLALPLRGRRGVHRTAGRAAARPTGHRLPRQLRLRSGRPGDPPGRRRHRSPGCPRPP